MAVETILTKIIELNYSELDENFEKHILKRLNTGICTKDIGHVLDISDILSLDSVPIVRGSNPSFSVTYKAKILKPEKGKKIKDCVVTLIFDQGIFLEYGPLQICVSILGKNNEITLSSDKKSFIFKKKEYKIGDNVNLEITAVQYEKHAFNTLAKLI
jgi:DNA-directed RNA polymerase subunit E'/Rpb7